MIKTFPVTKVLLVLMWLSVLSLAGCASFVKPEIGAIARPDARIALAKTSDGGVQSGAFTTSDLLLGYSFSESDNTFNLAGNLAFDRRVTDSFGMLIRFFMKMSFLDDQGRVLSTVDITPLYRAYGDSSQQLTLKASCAKPVGAVAVAFSYFGQFRSAGEDQGGGATWDISYFPF